LRCWQRRSAPLVLTVDWIGQGTFHIICSSQPATQHCCI